MRIKVNKLLKGGRYFVFLECLDFTPGERKKIKKFGMPVVDLTAEGLGIRRLDKLKLSLECPSQKEAEEITSHVQQKIKSKLKELSAQADDFTLGRAVNIYTRRIALVFGILSALAVLVLLAYQGVISSEKIAKLGKRLFSSTQNRKSQSSTSGKIVLSQNNPTSPVGSSANSPREFKENAAKTYHTKDSFGESSSHSSKLVKPDFTIIADPETLVRYYDWDSDTSALKDQTGSEQFKLILMAKRGFEGPVDLEVSGSCYMVKRHLYPTQIKTLPGSASLVISLLPRCPHQVCSDLTVTAKGITSNGDLILHRINLVLAIREKPSHSSRLWYVSSDGDDLSGYGDQASPFRTIQKGIDCAQAWDTVLVERGIYKENIKLTDKDNILVASRFILDQDETTRKSTTIEAHKKGWVITIGRSNEVTLQGFTIRKGKGNDGSTGGGIYCYDSSPNILDNVITKNLNQSGYGAGIYCYHSKPHILRNQIDQNHNYNGHGAGIYCYNSDPDIENNVITGNYSSGGGSAIHLLSPNSVRINRNLIYSDSGSSAILLYSLGASGDFQIINNTISHNQGDAVRFFGGPWVFKNNVITDNKGYGLFTLEGTADLAYNDIWGNVSGNICKRDTTNYYGLTENPIKNNGNLSKDPCFGNPVHGNFHLSFNSPCIDFGNPSDPVPPEGGSRIDMGAIEYTHPDVVCGDLNRDGLVDFGDISYLSRFLSRRASTPDPIQIGDVNCDDKIDKSDLAYLYRFLYYYGPEPGVNCKDRKLATSKK